MLGEVLWTLETGFTEIAGLAAFSDAVTICSDNGWVKRVDTSSGEVIWSLDLDCFINQGPVMDGGKIFVSAHKEIVILDLKSGEMAERIPATGPMPS